MKKVFTVTEVEGSKRSTNAEYTHALIGNYDWDKRIQLDSQIQDWQKCNYDWAKKNAAMSFEAYMSDNSHYTEQKAKENYSAYKATVDNYSNLSDYLQGMANDRVSNAKMYKEKNGSPVVVLAWASRFDLANNRISEFADQNYINLKVVPTLRVK